MAASLDELQQLNVKLTELSDVSDFVDALVVALPMLVLKQILDSSLLL